MSDWIDELFDDSEAHNYANPYHNARKYAARLVERSTLDFEEKEDLVGRLLDYDVEMTSNEIQDIIVAMQLNKMDPMQQYAPSKREIAAFIKKVCDL